MQTKMPPNLLGNWLDNVTYGNMMPRYQLMNQFVARRIDCGLTTEAFSKSYMTNDIDREMENIKEALVAQGYIFTRWAESDAFTFCKVMRDPRYVTDELMVGTTAMLEKQPHGFSLSCSGDATDVKNIQVIFTEKFKDSGVRVRTAVKVKNGQLVTETAIVDSNPLTDPRQVFYPYLKRPLKDYYSDFMAAKENVLILIGPAGTGKSTFLRGLATIGRVPVMVAYKKEVVQSPELIEVFHDSSSIKALALEDSDLFISSREGGNELMSSLLNNSEGLIPRPQKKLVFSTNLSDVNKIDPALLRRGRCFDVIRFDKLTVAEARAVEAEMGLPPQELDDHKTWTLSEILNPVDENRQMPSRDRTGIGFR